MGTNQEVKDGYTSTLQDLNCNSKPHISVLTMLAEENVANAKDIVAAIEEHLAKVRTEVKLPVLYLIDCIIKNVGGPYTAAFCNNIVHLFCSVFQVVDEKTRTEMYKLRQTWNDVIPKSKLYALDLKTSQMDPAWPITAAPPNIHFNPKFLNSNNAKIAAAKEVAKATVKPVVAPTPVVAATTVPESTLDMQQKLIIKQKQLLELQQKKLELELLQTQVKLQEQLKRTGTNVEDAAKQNSKVNNHLDATVLSSHYHLLQLLLKPEVAKQLLSDKKDESAKAMIAQINQRFPIANPSLIGQMPAIAPITNQLNNNSAMLGATMRPPIRDPRLLRQQAAAQQMSSVQSANVQLENKSNNTHNATTLDNKVVSNKIGRDARFVDNKDELIIPPKNNSKIQSRIPLKSKRSSSPSNKSSKSSSSRHSKSSGSGSCSSLDSPKKSASKALSSKYKSKSGGSSSRSSSDKRSSGKRDRRSPGKDMKSRNYRRQRAISISPEPEGKQDVDLRIGGPPEKQARITDETKRKLHSASLFQQSANGIILDEKDVDLRKNSIGGNKKRVSSESSEVPNSKKNRAEKKFDALFGSEDVDLRKLTSVESELPIAPPAPIISNKTSERTEKENTNGSQGQEPVPKLSLEVLRAKLANATNANKNKIQNSRLALQAEQKKEDKFSKKEDNKIFITPAEEENIKSGNMTKAQETSLMGKIIAQIENQKIKEAKRKENEENLNSMMTQPISDDEFDPDIDGKKVGDEVHTNATTNTKQSRFEPRFNREPQWKVGKRGSFIGPRPNRGRADPWIRPIPGPQWKPPFPGPLFDEDGKSNEPMEINNSPPPSLQDDICMSHENIKSINIDGEPRDILFYGETAIAFMSPEDPREISFQAGQRRVCFDDMNSYVLVFNDPYREVLVNGHCHRVRLGAPTREIYIDGKPYECIFGGPPIAIELDRKLVMITIDGPPPQVKIGTDRRSDLVVGKVNLIIDAKTIVTIYLDARTQTFDVDGTINTLRFKDSLKSVLINDQPYNLEFGGLPKGVMVNGRKHFIRFSVLPKGIRPGYVKISEMEGFKPPHLSDTDASQDGYDGVGGPGDNMPQPLMRPRKSRFSDHSPERNSPNHVLNLMQQSTFGNLDSLLSIASSALPPIPQRNAGSYQIEQPLPMIDSTQCLPTSNQQMPTINTTVPPPQTMSAPVVPSVLNPLNINDLFQKLVATGIVTSLQNAPPVQATLAKVSEAPNRNSPQPPSQNDSEVVQKQHHRNEAKMKHISFDDTTTLKARQPALIHVFYSGMQCSSCGMRFAQENSSLYSQHLDWHFRQNRRGKKNIRKASSRRWYYSITDWSNYEEIEDLEEREKCYFENQQKDQNENQNDDNEGEIEIPSVPADSSERDPRCEVCQEKLEQFYNEEKEEWHLKMAMRIDDKTYHPLCYEDYQVSLTNVTMDESMLSAGMCTDSEMKAEPETIPGFDVKKEEELPVIIEFDSSESKSNTPKPDLPETSDDETKTENPDDDAVVEGIEDEEPMETEDDDDDVVINEVEPEKIVLDDYEIDENGLIAGVVVKQEPIDDGFTDIENFHLGEKTNKAEATPDESFVDIGQVIEQEPVVPTTEQIEHSETSSETTALPAAIANLLPSTQQSPETISNTTTTTTTPPPTETSCTTTTTSTSTILSNNDPINMLTVPTIDGNLECNAGAPTMPTGGLSGKIKINISKPLPVIAPKENKDISSDVDNNIEPIDPTQPLPPGEEPVQLHLKPALQGIDLKQLPPVNKGSELTGLCSIM